MDIREVTATITRTITCGSSLGRTTSRPHVILAQKLPGCPRGETSKEHSVYFDLAQAQDPGTSFELTAPLGEFAGKIQQTYSGILFSVGYVLDILVNTGMPVYMCPSARVPITLVVPDRNEENGEMEGGVETARGLLEEGKEEGIEYLQMPGGEMVELGSQDRQKIYFKAVMSEDQVGVDGITGHEKVEQKESKTEIMEGSHKYN